MFRTTFCPSSGALSNCSRSLRFPYKSRGGCVSSRGRFVTNRPRLDTLPPRLKDFTTGCASGWLFFWTINCCSKRSRTIMNWFRYYTIYCMVSSISDLWLDDGLIEGKPKHVVNFKLHLEINIIWTSCVWLIYLLIVITCINYHLVS
jgi:hypothetical protein